MPYFPEHPQWKPDLRWPKNILNLAYAIALGEPEGFRLHDAMLEHGVSETLAKHAMNAKLGTVHSYAVGYPVTHDHLIGLIVGDGWLEFLVNDPKVPEIEDFLNRRGPKREVYTEEPSEVDA